MDFDKELELGLELEFEGVDIEDIDGTNILQSYKRYCQKYLTEEEFETVGVRDICQGFDPVYALIAEDLIVRKIGLKEWNSVVEKDTKESGGSLMKFLRLVKSFMCTPDPKKNMMFSKQTWEVNPTPTKLKNFMRFDDVVGKQNEFINKYSGIRDLLTSDKIVDIVDTKNIIAFKDGVLDVNRFEEGIRDGLPQDFVTTSIDYKILLRSDRDEHMKGELQNLLRSVFPIESVREYFLYYMSSCLDSGNLDKIFMIWYGLGNNGKSVVESLVESTFGSYCYKAPTSLFSSRRTSSSSATPEIANLNRTLISFIQESDSRENMNIGVLKELTGNDTIYVRNLYDNPKTIEVRCKFILVTNKIYNLSQADEATWARIKVLPFTSKFTSDKDLVNEEEGVFLMNPRYIRIARDLAPYFMRLLMEYYPKYKKDGLPRCEQVEEQTATLRRLNSPVSLFIEDELGCDPECSIRFQEAYEQYSSYARNNCGLRSVTAANFLANLEKLGVKVIEGNVIGYYLKNE